MKSGSPQGTLDSSLVSWSDRSPCFLTGFVAIGIALLFSWSAQAQTNGCATVPCGLVSWWRGEGNALDSIQINHGSMVGGVTIVPGKVGNAFSFDGNGFILVPHHPTLNCSNAMTIELWYNPAQSNDVSYGIIDKRVRDIGANYGINVAPGSGLGLYFDDLEVKDGDDTKSSFETSRHSPAPTPGIFHHLAATCHQVSSNLVQLETYIDGQRVRRRDIAGNLANTINSTPLTIGATAQGAGEYFRGVIDEISIYNRVLDAAEIQSIYAAAATGKCTGGATNFLPHTLTFDRSNVVPRAVNNPPSNGCYDASEAFTTNRNPNGVWAYGYCTKLGGSLSLFSKSGNLGGNSYLGLYDFWWVNSTLSLPVVFRNPANQILVNPTATIMLNPGQMAFYPGINGELAIIRFTAPTAGSYQISAEFDGAEIQGTTTDIHILLNGSLQRSGIVDGFGPGSGYSIMTNMFLRAGDQLDFAVGWGGNHNNYYDSTTAAIRICAASDIPSSSVPTSGGLMGR